MTVLKSEPVRKIQYLVRIYKDPDSDWGASVPDLPGCVSTGKTIDVALKKPFNSIFAACVKMA